MLSKFVTVALLFGSVLAAPSPAALQKLKRTSAPVVQDRFIVVLKDTASKQASIQGLNDLVFAQDDKTSFKEVTHSEWTGEVLSSHWMTLAD